jgi:hypothetical protein
VFISKQIKTEFGDDICYLQQRIAKLERYIAVICDNLQIEVVESTRISPDVVQSNSIKVIKRETKTTSENNKPE